MEVLPSRSVLSRSSSSGVHLFFWFVDTELLPLRLQPSFARQPLGFQAFAIFLKFRTGLAVRGLLLRRVWVEGLSITATNQRPPLTISGWN
jgi:hypothetical protein